MHLPERRASRAQAVLFVAIALLCAGCTGPRRIDATSGEEAYRQGKSYLKAGKYEAAIRAFQVVPTFGIAGRWTQPAQYLLAKSYLANDRYARAIQAYTEFLNRYPDAERAEQAEFERAVAYYRRSPSYEHGQSITEEALRHLRLFLSRYPNSEYARRAGEMADRLVHKLARHRYHAAKLYERLEYFESAAITYERVLEEYPRSEWADDALLGAIRSRIAYGELLPPERQRQQLQEARAIFHQFSELFPDSPLMDEAEALHDQIVKTDHSRRDS